MKSNQEQLLKTLQGHIPEDAQTAVMEAVSEFFEKATADLESEYESRLNKSFEQFQEELNESERVGYEGYQKAWEIITDLKDRLSLQKEEFEQTLEESHAEAWEMLQAERAKSDTLEVGLHEEYSDRFKDVKSLLVDKLDVFLQQQGDKYETMIKKQVMNDPAVVENKIAFDRILDIAANCLSDEDFSVATNAKVENLEKQLTEAQAQLKLLESKSMRLMMENNRLSDFSRQKLLTEQKERKVRIERSRKAEGRGEAETERQVVIGEAEENVKRKRDRKQDVLTENNIGEEIFNDWQHLAGLDKE